MSPVAKVISHSPEQTEALGAGWGLAAAPGIVIALLGDLGAGKTRLVKGLARGLGSPARVHSPTFALLNAYEGGRHTLYHLDLYRLDSPDQILAAGLDAYLPSDGVTVVEWADRWFGLQPPSNPAAHGLLTLRWVRIDVLDETTRHIQYQDLG